MAAHQATAIPIAAWMKECVSCWGCRIRAIRASLEPDELSAMVDGIRHIEQALGDGVKRVSPSEEKNIVIARKSIVARCPIKKGEVLTEENLAVKRPGSGISPMQWYKVLGTRAVRNFEEDELIEW